MTIHVGIYHQNDESTFYVSTYDTVTTETNVFTLNQLVENEQINFASIFEDLRASTEDEFGCICIYLGENYDNDFRKEIVEFGEAFGFQKVEILNFYGNQYLQAVYNANYVHQEGEVIWVAELDGTYIWEKVNGKAQLFAWFPWGPSTKTEFDKLQVVVDVHGKHPKVMFCHPKIFVDDSLMKKVLPNTLVITSVRFPNLNIPLIKARILAADEDLMKFEYDNALKLKAILQYSNKNVVSFTEFQKLPCQKSVKIVKATDEDYIQLRRGNKIDEILLPDHDIFILTVTFDVNEIYHFTFDELPFCTADTETEFIYTNLLNKANIELPSTTYLKKYEMLTEDILNNDISVNGIGIDFGSTFCRAAVNRRTGIEVMALDYHGQRNLASYVSFDEEKAKCGKIVHDRLRNHGKSSVYGMKSFIGLNYTNISINPSWPFQIIPKENDSFCIAFSGYHGAQSKCAEEVSAVLFNHIKKWSENFEGRDITETVITFPYEFNKRQRSGIYVSALLAGWQCVYLLPEPIAAVLGYSLKFSLLNQNTVLVVDFGGGSLKVCILKIVNSQINILGYQCSQEISGNVIDNLIAEYLEQKLFADFGIIVDENKKYKLMAESKNMKEHLSFEIKAWVDAEDFDYSCEGQTFITRTEFEELTSSLLSKIKVFIEDAILQTKTSIDKILYVGGGCRMPMIKNLLQEIFPTSEHCCDIQSDEINAIGAAYYSYYLNLTNTKVEVKHNIPSSVGKAFSTKFLRNITFHDISLNGIGIDFGTVSCLSACVRRNGLETIALDNSGQRILPSYVSYDEEHEKCGQIVIDRLRNYAKLSAYDMKKFIGCSYSETNRDPSWPFQLVELVNNSLNIILENSDGYIFKFPEEVLAVLFKHIKTKAEEFQNRELNEVVITFPYNFHDKHRSGISTAALLAGWKSVHFLPEPIAAVYGYLMQAPISNLSTILVIDFGGESFNTCVLRINNDEIVTLRYHNCTTVTGRMFDSLLVNYFEEKLQSDYGINISSQKRYKLIAESQKIKETLSFEIEAMLEVDDFDVSKEGSIRITRSELEIMATTLLNNARTAIYNVIHNEKIFINKVFYVGGGCRMPMIKNLLQEMFPTSEHCCNPHPDEVIAIGATYYAYYLNLSARQILGMGLLNDAVFDIMRVILREPTLIPTILRTL